MYWNEENMNKWMLEIPRNSYSNTVHDCACASMDHGIGSQPQKSGNGEIYGPHFTTIYNGLNIDSGSSLWRGFVRITLRNLAVIAMEFFIFTL